MGAAGARCTTRTGRATAGFIRPGTAQRLSAGTGVQHSEQNASARRASLLVFVQMMLSSDHDAEPEYAQVDVDPQPGELTPTVAVHTGAELFVVRLTAGRSVTVPAARRSLVHVMHGAVDLDGTTLTSGDEARLTDAGAYDLSAAGDGGDVLVWQLQR